MKQTNDKIPKFHDFKYVFFTFACPASQYQILIILNAFFSVLCENQASHKGILMILS